MCEEGDDAGHEMPLAQRQPQLPHLFSVSYFKSYTYQIPWQSTVWPTPIPNRLRTVTSKPLPRSAQPARLKTHIYEGNSRNFMRCLWLSASPNSRT